MDKQEEKIYTVYESKGQYKVTLNRVLAQAMGIKKGTKFKWIIDRGDLILKKV